MVLDVNTQVGDDYTVNQWDFHIFEVHKMTLGACLVFGIITFVCLALGVYLYRKHIKKVKRKHGKLLAITYQGTHGRPGQSRGCHLKTGSESSIPGSYRGQ